MNKNKKSYVVPGVIALVIALFAALGVAWYRKPASGPSGPTAVARKGSLTETAAATGKIEPDIQVEVKSRASGAVVEVLVKEGDRVETGQLLVRLDTTDTDRALSEALVARDRVRANIAAAQASVAVSEMERKNDEITQEVAEKSAGLGLASTDAARTATHSTQVAVANLSLKRAQLSSAQADLKAAELTVQNAETRLKETKIYAPFAGTVLDVAVEKGTIVSSALTNVSGGSAVMTLADLSNLRIVGAIDEAQIGRVSPGQRVDIRVDAYPERVFKGTVDRVSPLGKEVSSIVTFDVEIKIVDKEASLLRSGMSADVEIVTSEQKDVLLVPLLAVQSMGTQRFVRLANGERRPIRTGATDGTQMVVLEGLNEGDQILASAPAPATTAKPADQKRSGMQTAMPLGGGSSRGGR